MAGRSYLVGAACAGWMSWAWTWARWVLRAQRLQDRGATVSAVAERSAQGLAGAH